MVGFGDVFSTAMNIGIGMPLQAYYNRKAASRANAYNLGMWQAENEYNRPINQMARLEEAGLNPNLVYGGGATTLSASSKSAVPAQAPSVPDFVKAYQDIRQRDAQTQNIEANTEIARRMWPVDHDVKNMQFHNLSTQNDILKETRKQEEIRTMAMANELSAQIENAEHKTGRSYRWSRNIGEWMNALSPFIQSGTNVGESYLSKPRTVNYNYNR